MLDFRDLFASRRWLELGLILASAALIIFGWEQDNFLLVGIGLSVAGIAFILWGLEAVLSKQFTTYDEYADTNIYRTYTYSGLAAVLRGFGSISLGLALIVLGILVILNAGTFVQAFVESYPGLVVSLFAVAGIIMILPEIIGSDQFRKRNIISKSLGRIVRSLGLLLCVAIAVLGVLYTNDPAIISDIIALLPEDVQQTIEAMAQYQQLMEDEALIPQQQD